VTRVPVPVPMGDCRGSFSEARGVLDRSTTKMISFDTRLLVSLPHCHTAHKG
jgi:hypothetical protein